MGNEAKPCTKCYVVREPPELSSKEEAWVGADAVAICVMRCSELRAQDLNGLADPYVCVKINDEPLGDQAQRTRVVFKNLNPVWRPFDCLVFHYTANDAHIYISVHDWDLRTADEVAGFNTIPVKEFLNTRNQEMTVKLCDGATGSASEQTVTIRATHLTGRQAVSFREDCIFEYERFSLTHNWRAEKRDGDPGHWASNDFSAWGDTQEEVEPPVPAGWEVLSKWGYYASPHCDDGWHYATSKDAMQWAAHSCTTSFRRRIWRRVVYDPTGINAQDIPKFT